MKKCRLQLLGSPKPFKLVVDHQALVTILDKQTLDAVQNPRLQGMKERLMRFNFTTVWNKGKTHAIPNALSRSPVSNPSADDVDDHLACIHQVRASVQGTVAELSATGDPAGTSAGLSDPLLTALSVAGSADHDYMALLHTVQHGFPPTIGKTPTAVTVNWNWKIRQDLSHHDGLVLKGTRIVIPNSQRSHILTRLHASHQGTRRTLARERQLVYRPGMSNDVTTTVTACETCQVASPSNPAEPLMVEDPPAYPFQDVSMDIFAHAGNLVYADRLSS